MKVHAIWVEHVDAGGDFGQVLAELMSLLHQVATLIA